ncbi:MAG: hypothetical protein QXY95_05715 [Thermosphaera sp.]
MVKLTRRIIEEFLILLGLLALIFIFQPFSLIIYTVGWMMILICTLVYVILTLVPSHVNSRKELFKMYFRTLVIVVGVVLVFLVVSIALTPYLV